MMRKTQEGYNAYKNDSLVFGVVMAAFIDTSLQYKSWYYTIINPNGIASVKVIEDTPSKLQYPFFRITGYQNAIFKELKLIPMPNRVSFVKKNLIGLIELEVLDEPTKVGLPINVIVLFKDGYKWLTKNSDLCY